VAYFADTTTPAPRAPLLQVGKVLDDDHRRVGIRRTGRVAARLHLHDGVVDLDFYNLFLAVVSGIGIALVAMGNKAVGAALIFAGVGSMAAAAVVLLLSSPDKARAALTQGTFPVIAVVLLTLGLIR
jgi:hypothetical protein